MKGINQGLLAVAAGLILASSALAYDGTYNPNTGINGTPHDLGIATNGMNYVSANNTDNLQRICIYCHAPHNTYRLDATNGGPAASVGAGPQASPEFDYLPLWNHTLQTNTAYSMYWNGPGAPQTGAQASQAVQLLGSPTSTSTPGGTSLLCLSCHDGSVAVNSYGNANQLTRSQSAGSAVMSDQYLVGAGNYLGNHHPIGFSYTAAYSQDNATQGGLRPVGTLMVGTQSINDHLYGAAGTMECGSCHSVHNQGNQGENLLWRSDSRSQLCLTCHAKGTYTAAPALP